MTATILITCDCGTCTQLQLVPAHTHAEARTVVRSDTRGEKQWTGDGERDYAPGHAVSEDQPKPREWHKGDEEPPADVTVLEDHDGDRITRGENGWVWTRVLGEDYAITPWSPSHAWADIDWTGIDTLSEVLADSEQVRHG